MSSPRIQIIDATLREGAQAPGVRWTPDASVQVARDLVDAGVDAIECGHPVVGPEERARIAAVRAADLGVPVLVHARALPEDVAAAADAGVPWVGIFLGFNDVARRTRVRRSVPELLDLLRAAVADARRRGLRVRYTLEDATRTAPDLALSAYRVAVDAGADRIGLADTTGCAEPSRIAGDVARLRDAFRDVPVEVHLHDDRGLALANVLAAVDAGATWVSTAVLGLGERCGIPDLAATLANLAARGSRRWPPGGAVQRVSARVARLTGSPPDARRPVIGEHAFTHTARLHVRAMGRDPESYAWVDAERLGRAVELGTDEADRREREPASVSSEAEGDSSTNS